MCTYLGASVEFEPKDIDFTVIKESKYLYLEGYLWDSELAKKAFIKENIATVAIIYNIFFPEGQTNLFSLCPIL